MRPMSRGGTEPVVPCTARPSRLAVLPSFRKNISLRVSTLRLLIVLPIVLLAVVLSGCASIAVTLAGLGVGAGASHYMNSVTYRTFTEPVQTVKQAALVSLVRMKIELETTEHTDKGLLIRARTTNRTIEIELEEVTGNSTRMRTVAHQDDSVFLDAATAAEVIAQTEKTLATVAPVKVADKAPATSTPAKAAEKTQATSTPLKTAARRN
jgi:hypothetical protein